MLCCISLSLAYGFKVEAAGSVSILLFAKRRSTYLAEALASVAASRMRQVHTILLVDRNVVLQRYVGDLHVIVRPLAEKLDLRRHSVRHLLSLRYIARHLLVVVVDRGPFFRS